MIFPEQRKKLMHTFKVLKVQHSSPIITDVVHSDKAAPKVRQDIQIHVKVKVKKFGDATTRSRLNRKIKKLNALTKNRKPCPFCKYFQISLNPLVLT